MAYTFTCDWCGGEIKGGSRKAVEVRTHRDKGDEDRDGWLAHYHDDHDEPGCIRQVRDALDLIRGVGEVVESSPMQEARELPAGRDVRKPRNEGRVEATTGGFIRALRHTAGLSQEALGRLLDPPTGQAGISQLERGVRVPSVEQVEEIVATVVARIESQTVAA